MKNISFSLLMLFLCLNTISCFSIKRSFTVIEGKTSNLKFYQEPLLIGNDGYLYVIRSKESKGISKYTKTTAEQTLWRTSSLNKKVMLKLEEIIMLKRRRLTQEIFQVGQ